VAAALSTALIVVGCGSNVRLEGQQLRAQSLLANSPPLPRAIVTDPYIEQYPAESAQRAFYAYWQALQFDSWRRAAAWYDPRLQHVLGLQTLIGSLEALASFYRSVKPVVYHVKATPYGTTELTYVGSRSGAPVNLETIEWLHVGSTWRIESDSFLNEGLLVFAGQAEQERIDPAAQVLAPQAVRAGRRAVHLQAGYLATLIDETQTAHPGSAAGSP
jgi:hypothetical protein